MKTADLLKGVSHWRFVPDGVADPVESRAFIRDADGGIAAVDLANGSELWRTADASIPLIALNGAVLAATDGDAALRLIDAAAGTPLPWQASAALPLPADAQWSPIAAWCDGGSVFVAWRTLAGAEGVAAIELESGRVSDQPPQPRLSTADAALRGEQALFRSALGTAEPWRAGDRLAAVIVERTRGKERLRLKTWMPGGAAKQKGREMLSSLPAPGYLQHYPSPDVDHVFLLACNDTQMEEALPGSVCDWLVFHVDDGKRIAVIRNRREMLPPPAVAGSRFLCVEIGAAQSKKHPTPRTLCVYDLRSGDRVWTHGVAAIPRGRRHG